MPFEVAFQNFSSWPQSVIIPDATAKNDGVMTKAQAANMAILAQIVAAGGADALLALLSFMSQSPTPFVDEVQTTDATPVDVALISELDNPSSLLSISVRVQAYSDDLTQFFDVQLSASYKGDGAGNFTRLAAAQTLYGPVAIGADAAGWTAVLTDPAGVGVPKVELAGGGASPVNWKVNSEAWSAA